MQAGAGAPPWNDFVGNVDDFYITTTATDSVAAVNDVVDFDPAPRHLEPATFRCRAAGLALFIAMSRFRRQRG